MSLLDMKALWFSLMIVGNTTFSRLATTFEEILETTLLRLMGQYSVIFFGSLTLGMRVMWVSLNFGGTTPKFRKSSTHLVTHSPTIGQKC